MVSFAAEQAGDIAKMARVKNLGTLLNEVYPNGARAPDDFAHWVVDMHRPEVPVAVEIPTQVSETMLRSQEPNVVVSITRSKNPTSPNRSPVNDLEMSG
jgi:hypothetical protein